MPFFLNLTFGRVSQDPDDVCDCDLCNACTERTPAIGFALPHTGDTEEQDDLELRRRRT